MKTFDFEPQFLAGQITGQSFWDKNTWEVGQPIWDGVYQFNQSSLCDLSCGIVSSDTPL